MYVLHASSKKKDEPLHSKKKRSLSLFDDLPETSEESKQKTPDSEVVTPGLLGGQLHTSSERDDSENSETSVSLKRKSENSGEMTEDETKAKRPAFTCCELEGYFAERQGEREDMQDAHVIINNFTPHLHDLHPSIHRLAYYGVFDGHAGARASKYCAARLHKNITEKFPKGDLTKVESEIKRCLLESYKKTDEEFLKLASKSKPSWKDGTTATTLLVINNTVYIANLGDSKAVLCRYNESENKYHAIPLTKDHNPQDFNERMRIQKAGGQVRDGRVMGVLEVSRSLGDGPYKNHGVSSVPDVKRCQLTKNDQWILVACDGLWKTFTNDAVQTFTNKILKEHTDLTSSEDSRWDTACQRLASEAVRRLSADNVTVVLIKISNTQEKS